MSTGFWSSLKMCAFRCLLQDRVWRQHPAVSNQAKLPGIPTPGNVRLAGFRPRCGPLNWPAPTGGQYTLCAILATFELWNSVNRQLAVLYRGVNLLAYLHMVVIGLHGWAYIIQEPYTQPGWQPSPYWQNIQEQLTQPATNASFGRRYKNHGLVTRVIQTNFNQDGKL